MGLEPVWKDHEYVFVSDAGGIFDFQADRDLLWRVKRYQAVQENQTRALRKRWLIANFMQATMSGAYWATTSARSSYSSTDTEGYSKALAQDVIGCIRTDLDAFSDAEAAILQNHGYLLADAAIHTHCSSLLDRHSPASPPYPDWLPPATSEVEIRKVLANSHKRTALGRFAT
jgi:NTE family protein